MVKTVLFGKEARDKLLVGVKAITKAVSVTMGANGKCVLVGEGVYGNDGMIQLPTKVTKDGWTVTKHFEMTDPVENRGAMMIKEAATKTVEMVGDATTCTCVLAESMITKGMELVEGGANSQELKKGMDKALEYVVSELAKASTPVKGDIERIRQIATVSANNDEVIGTLISDAFEKIGSEGIIDIEESQTTETEIKVTGGYKFDKGWVSPFFINNAAKEICEFENPLILLYEKKITHHTQIEAAVLIARQRQMPLLIIAEDCDEEGLAYLAINNQRKEIVVCVVKSPEFGNLRRDAMEDIALLTGGDYISDIKGIDIKEVTLANFGTAKKVIVSKNETIIIEGKKNKEDFEDFVNNLKMNLAETKVEAERYAIEKRIAKLSGSVAVIHVGAATETELNEKIDRVDDSVRSTRAAIAEGFVAGGGTAFLRIKNQIPEDIGKDRKLGMEIVFDALTKPLKQICENAGVDKEEIYSLVKAKEGNIGYNALTGELVDMVDAGIIDSTKALRCALINSVSVAGMVLTSECSIITIH